MDIYAIGDLHLQGGADKPMNVFGPQWEGHFDRIRRDWREKVRENDVVLLPGDISWAMQTEDALDDLRSIGELPGRKILLRGNHDYWWCGISRLRELLRGLLEAELYGPEVRAELARLWSDGSDPDPAAQRIYGT